MQINAFGQSQMPGRLNRKASTELCDGCSRAEKGEIEVVVIL